MLPETGVAEQTPTGRDSVPTYLIKQVSLKQQHGRPLCARDGLWRGLGPRRARVSIRAAGRTWMCPWLLCLRHLSGVCLSVNLHIYYSLIQGFTARQTLV